MPTNSGKSSKKRSGFDASYLSGLSQQADEADIFGPVITQKHQELQHEMETADQSRVPHIALHLLQDNPFQSRRVMDEEELKKLADDIQEGGFQGVLVARPHPSEPGVYQIVSGHRRKKAAQRAGLATLPVMIKDYTDEEMLFLQAKENLLREQLTPLDEAYMFQDMMMRMGYTQEAIAVKVRQSRGYVRNRLALVKAPEDVQAMVRQDKETVRAAYYLSEVENTALRAELIEAILEKKITGESIPGYLASWKEEQQRREQAARISPATSTTEQISVSPISNAMPPTTDIQEQPLASLQSKNGQADIPLQEPQISVERVMEAGEKRSKELLEIGKLRTILNQLQQYQSRCAKRQIPFSSEELALLKAIEDVVHRVQDSSAS